MNLAKQSTAKSFILGPILDADGVAKTDEVVGSVKVTKNGSVGSPNDSSTLTHDHTGHYVYAGHGGDFDTLGEVEFTLNSGTNAMAPVKFQVVPANTYDSLVGGSDNLDVTTDSASRDASKADVSALALASVCTEARLSELDAGTSGKAANQIDEIRSDTEDIQSRLPAALVSGRMSSDAVAISGSTDAADKLEASAETMVTGTATATTLSTTQMSTNLTETTNSHYNGRIIIWTSGDLIGQATEITGYNGSTKTLTYTAVTEAPSEDDTFVIV